MITQQDIDRFAELCGLKKTISSYVVEDENNNLATNYLYVSKDGNKFVFDPRTDATHALMLAEAARSHIGYDGVYYSVGPSMEGGYRCIFYIDYDLTEVARGVADTFPLAICEAVKAALEAQ